MKEREQENQCVIKFHEEFPKADDPIISVLHIVIKAAIHVLAILMVLVIIWGVFDVIFILFNHLKTPPYLLLNISQIIELFGAFIAVLIAVEIFVNIRLYLGTYTFPVKLVCATALMAISRKVIVLDFNKVSFEYVFGIGTVVLAMGVVYWLVAAKTEP